MSRYRLLDTHPTVQKLRQLEDFAQRLGLTLIFHEAQAVTVTDTGRPGEEFEVRDLDGHNHTPDMFPAVFEYKLIR